MPGADQDHVGTDELQLGLAANHRVLDGRLLQQRRQPVGSVPHQQSLGGHPLGQPGQEVLGIASTAATPRAIAAGLPACWTR